MRLEVLKTALIAVDSFILVRISRRRFQHRRVRQSQTNKLVINETSAGRGFKSEADKRKKEKKNRVDVLTESAARLWTEIEFGSGEWDRNGPTQAELAVARPRLTELGRRTDKTGLFPVVQKAPVLWQQLLKQRAGTANIATMSACRQHSHAKEGLATFSPPYPPSPSWASFNRTPVSEAALTGNAVQCLPLFHRQNPAVPSEDKTSLTFD